MIYRVIKKNKILRAEIDLPSSKSESNRVLMIRALCRSEFPVKNLSEADDTRTMKQILSAAKTSKKKYSTPIVHDAGPAGTVMRFLTAYFAVTPGSEVILTGSNRMKERPIEILVNALKVLGADIQYLEKEGYPPLRIKGKELSGKKIKVDGSMSSQFISALLMIAPVLKNGLTVQFQGEIVSKPYIEMTLKIMSHFGIKYEQTNNSIQIDHQEYQPADYTMESDWSAAGYWYAIAVMSDTVRLYLRGLKKNSYQGDAIVAKLFKPLGIMTSYKEDGILLSRKAVAKKPAGKKWVKIDFSACPDLAQTLAVTYAALGISVHLTGLKTLRIKETDRVKALQNELKKLGVKSKIVNNNDLIIQPGINQKNQKKLLARVISTYHDHRMAMAFAPLAAKFREIKIEDPGVVKKSYPGFWTDLKKVGFRISKFTLHLPSKTVLTPINLLP